MTIFSAGVIDADGDIYPGGLEPGTVIYTADHIREVEQQRDELLKALDQIKACRRIGIAHIVAVNAIAKVKP